MSKRKGSNASVPASEQGDKRQKSTSTNGAPSRTAVVSTADVVEATVQSAMNLAIKDAKDNKLTIMGWTVGWVNTLDKEGAKHCCTQVSNRPKFFRFVCLYANICVRGCVCVHMYMCGCTRICADAYVYVDAYYVYVLMHMNMCVCICICVDAYV